MVLIKCTLATVEIRIQFAFSELNLSPRNSPDVL